MAGRPLLVALLAVIALMVASWTLGEWLRQRKDKKRSPEGANRRSGV